VSELFAAMGSMEPITIGLWVTGAMLLLVVIGVRVAFAAAIAGFLGLLWIFSAKFGFEKGFGVAVKMAGTIPHSKVSTLALSLIPTFILIGFLAYHAGLTKALFEAAKRWLGWLPGGMGVATVFSTAGFAAVSGASVATSAVFARIAVPEMLKLGYDKRFAAGVVAAGGTLASLIPPSAILVIYAIIVEQDVGALLMAGFLPGAVSAVIYGGLVILLAVTSVSRPCRGRCRSSPSSPSSWCASTAVSARRPRPVHSEPSSSSAWRSTRAPAGPSSRAR
jgi:TRAP-type mannitol/chloroaromatic compound transport system permease large subunit